MREEGREEGKAREERKEGREAGGIKSVISPLEVSRGSQARVCKGEAYGA